MSTHTWALTYPADAMRCIVSCAGASPLNTPCSAVSRLRDDGPRSRSVPLALRSTSCSRHVTVLRPLASSLRGVDSTVQSVADVVMMLMTGTGSAPGCDADEGDEHAIYQ